MILYASKNGGDVWRLPMGFEGEEMAETTDTTWFLYLVRCADGSLYTGITNNVPRRCKQHNAGIASRYTRSRLPVKLIHQESHASRSMALKRELAVKAMSREEKELLIRLER